MATKRGGAVNTARMAQIERRRKIRAAEAELDRARTNHNSAKSKLAIARDNLKRIKGGK